MNGAYSFTVWGTAAPQGSKRHVGNGVMRESSPRVYTWRDDVRCIALENLPAQWDPRSAIRLDLTFCFQRPNSHYGRKAGILYLKRNAPPEPTSGRLGDLDKLQRAIFDALTGIVYADDRQVVEVHASKVYLSEGASLPYTSITITPLQ